MERDLTPAEEQIVTAIVRTRLLATVLGCRELLLASRGGLQMLEPIVAHEIGLTLNNLDSLALKLTPQPQQPLFDALHALERLRRSEPT